MGRRKGGIDRRVIMEIKYVTQIEDMQSIQRFEESYGIQFPKEFLEFIKVNNGGRPKEKVFSLENGTEYIVNAFLSFNENDFGNIYWPKEQMEEEGVDAVPFASDPFGNYFCFQDGRVVFWFHEDGEFVALCDSFGEFIDRLVRIDD